MTYFDIRQGLSENGQTAARSIAVLIGLIGISSDQSWSKGMPRLPTMACSPFLNKGAKHLFLARPEIVVVLMFR
jgi:hypothetical protein